MAEMFTHIAFSDDSKHQEGRYNSLGLVTVNIANAKSFHTQLKKLLKDSGINSEFKWSKLTGAKYRFAANKLIDFVFQNQDKLRIDVLIWDMKDSRHKNIRHRDDKENLVRMYYHLISSTCSKKWPTKDVKWIWYPDHQSSVKWHILEDCIRTKKHHRVADLFGINPEFERINLVLNPVESHKYPMVQVADLFAGLGAYSWGNFDRFRLWKEQHKGEDLFAKKSLTFSISEKERFQIISDFRERCKYNDMKIGLESSKGLESHNSRKTINFWLYRPQHISDKAPIK